jgi:hypothetical protein
MICDRLGYPILPDIIVATCVGYGRNSSQLRVGKVIELDEGSHKSIMIKTFGSRSKAIWKEPKDVVVLFHPEAEVKELARK